MTGYCEKHDETFQDGPCPKCLQEAWEQEQKR